MRVDLDSRKIQNGFLSGAFLILCRAIYLPVGFFCSPVDQSFLRDESNAPERKSNGRKQWKLAASKGRSFPRSLSREPGGALKRELIYLGDIPAGIVQ